MGLSVRTRVLFCCCGRSKWSLIVPSLHVSLVRAHRPDPEDGASERENGVHHKTRSTTTSKLSPQHILLLPKPNSMLFLALPRRTQSLVLQGHPSLAEGNGRRSSRLCEAGLA